MGGGGGGGEVWEGGGRYGFSVLENAENSYN